MQSLSCFPQQYICHLFPCIELVKLNQTCLQLLTLLCIMHGLPKVNSDTKCLFWWNVTLFCAYRNPVSVLLFNSSLLEQDVCHYTDDIFRYIFMNETFHILICISLKCHPKGTYIYFGFHCLLLTLRVDFGKHMFNMCDLLKLFWNSELLFIYVCSWMPA